METLAELQIPTPVSWEIPNGNAAGRISVQRIPVRADTVYEQLHPNAGGRTGYLRAQRGPTA